MNHRLGSLPIRLRTREVLDINDGQGLTVTCLDGALWVTQADDPKDVVLEAGQSFVLTKPGLTLVSAPSDPSTVLIGAAKHAVQKTRAHSARAGQLRAAA